ncbi:delta 1-pyrroline-5-carboxylate reductase [Saitoella coloradoensis]
MVAEAPTLCALGCGTMGIAILSGILDSLKDTTSADGASTPDGHKVNKPSRFLACIRSDKSLQKLEDLFKGEVTCMKNKNVEAVKQSDIILLGSKPQMSKEILTAPGMREALEGKLLISILAGTTLSQLRSWCPQSTHVVRAMPNTPCKIRQGMTVLVCEEEITSDERSLVQWMFSQIGRAMFLEEKNIDAATALCGSGPAFAAVFMEALADGGVMMGLTRAAALELAAQTCQGTARMVLDGQHPALIKDAVSTPGGCTISGLLALEDGKIRSTVARTIQDATERATALGKLSSK